MSFTFSSMFHFNHFCGSSIFLKLKSYGEDFLVHNQNTSLTLGHRVPQSRRKFYHPPANKSWGDNTNAFVSLKLVVFYLHNLFQMASLSVVSLWFDWFFETLSPYGTPAGLELTVYPRLEWTLQETPCLWSQVLVTGERPDLNCTSLNTTGQPSLHHRTKNKILGVN